MVAAMARSNLGSLGGLGLVSLSLLFGCGGPTTDDPAGDESEAVGGADEQAEGETTAAPFEPTLARGITITEVEANPGVGVPIALGAEWVGPAERNARLPRDRDTLLRVQFTVDPDWIPRDIEARLLLSYEDGSSQTLTATKFIEGDSNPNFLDTGFFWGLVAEEGMVQPGMSFQVQLWEVAEGGESLAEGVPSSPAGGPSLVGVEPAPMEMNVMFVPIVYNGSGPNVADDVKTFMVENGLLQHNPLQSVNYEWHEPVEYDQPLTELGDLLPVMAQLRQSEGNFATNWFYTAIIRTGGNSLNGTKGIAYRVGAAPGVDRVSAVVWNQTGSSTDTLVHEVGHNQGFQHVYCQGGNADNTDPTYKNETGETGSYGFGIRDYTLRRPTDVFEYMTYCDPSWVSDWTWNKAYYNIQTLTSWDYEDKLELPPSIDVLKAVVFDDGHGTWWIGPASLDVEESSGNYLFDIETHEGTTTHVARARTLSDGAGVWMEMPLGTLTPEDFVKVAARTPDYTAQVERSSFRKLASP
jgi:hypothetical protein